MYYGRYNELSIKRRLSLLNVPQKATEQHSLLKTMTDKLYEGGYVKENFYEALIEREHQFPTGIQGKYGCFAIPHAGIEYANKSTLAIATSKDGIEFNNMENGSKLKCRVVIMLSIREVPEYIEILKKLMFFISK